MASERTGLFQLPRDTDKAVRHLSSKPVKQLLAPGLTTDDDGRMMVDAGEGITVDDEDKLTLDPALVYMIGISYGRVG